MDFNISLRRLRSIVSADRPTVEADGTLPTIFSAYEKSLEALNLLSEPRFEKRMDIIEAAISEQAICGFALKSEISSINSNRLKYLLE